MPEKKSLRRKENLRVFVLGVVQNGKLGVENLGNILRDFREPRVFDLTISPLLSRSKPFKYPVNIYQFVPRAYVYKWKICENRKSLNSI